MSRGVQYRVLDGGLSTELASNHGHAEIDGDPLWSARLIATEPQVISRVHDSFLLAGADILQTATYQASIAGFMEHMGYSYDKAASIFADSVRLAKDAADRFRAQQSKSSGNDYVETIVAGSIGPYGAHLQDRSEYIGSYIGKVSEMELVEWHRPQAEALVRAGADVLAFETIPSVQEAQAIVKLLRELPDVKAWISFSCMDSKRLCHGEELSVACQGVVSCQQCIGVGINCTAPQYIEPLLQTLAHSGISPGQAIIVYPNSGETWTQDRNCRWIPGEEHLGYISVDKCLESLVSKWMDVGANWIGGCCRFTPEHIVRIKTTVIGRCQPLL